MSTRRKWTHEDILNEVKHSMNILNIDRMPTAPELISINRNDLHCAICRRGTYKSIADELNIVLKRSETTKGHYFESYIMNILKLKGYDVISTSNQHPYDLLVNNSVKIEVKSGRQYDFKGSKCNTFSFSNRYSPCDIIICIAQLEDGIIDRIFIIPSHVLNIVTMSVGKKSIYNKYINNWDIIQKYVDFHSSIT